MTTTPPTERPTKQNALHCKVPEVPATDEHMRAEFEIYMADECKEPMSTEEAALIEKFIKWQARATQRPQGDVDDEIADIHRFISMFQKFMPELEKIDTNLRYALHALPVTKPTDARSYDHSTNTVYVMASHLFKMLERMGKEEMRLRAALSVSKPAMGELSEDEAVQIRKMLTYLNDMRERKSYGGIVMANFFAHWHELINTIGRRALAATTLSPKGDEELVEAAEHAVKMATSMIDGYCRDKNPDNYPWLSQLKAALSRHQARRNGEG